MSVSPYHQSFKCTLSQGVSCDIFEKKISNLRLLSILELYLSELAVGAEHCIFTVCCGKVLNHLGHSVCYPRGFQSCERSKVRSVLRWTRRGYCNVMDERA